MPMDIETLKRIIANTPDGMHKKDLIRQLKRLYRKNRLKNVLYFTTLNDRDDRRDEEAFYFALLCCAARRRGNARGGA